MQNLTIIENGLIPVYTTDNGTKIVDGRELWIGLKSKTDFSNWIKRRLIECDAIENQDYSSFAKIGERETGATTRYEYIINLPIAKEMAMLERNEIGKQVRKYFITIEEKYSTLMKQFQLNTILPELKTMFVPVEQHNLLSEKVSKYEKSTIDYKQSERLRRLGAERIINLFGGKTDEYKEHSKKVFFELWKDYKRHFHVASYKDIPIEKYEEGLNFVSNWEPTENIIDSIAI